jgi:hypothetical protein
MMASVLAAVLLTELADQARASPAPRRRRTGMLARLRRGRRATG